MGRESQWPAYKDLKLLRNVTLVTLLQAHDDAASVSRTSVKPTNIWTELRFALCTNSRVLEVASFSSLCVFSLCFLSCFGFVLCCLTPTSYLSLSLCFLSRSVLKKLISSTTGSQHSTGAVVDFQTGYYTCTCTCTQSHTVLWKQQPLQGLCGSCSNDCHCCVRWRHSVVLQHNDLLDAVSCSLGVFEAQKWWGSFYFVHQFIFSSFHSAAFTPLSGRCEIMTAYPYRNVTISLPKKNTLCWGLDLIQTKVYSHLTNALLWNKLQLCFYLNRLSLLMKLVKLFLMNHD